MRTGGIAVLQTEWPVAGGHLASDPSARAEMVG